MSAAWELLAKELDGLHLHAAAALVREDRRDLFTAIENDVRHNLAGDEWARPVLSRLVTLWGSGLDAAVVRGIEAWNASEGCEACALRAIEGIRGCDGPCPEHQTAGAPAACNTSAIGPGISVGADGPRIFLHLSGWTGNVAELLRFARDAGGTGIGALEPCPTCSGAVRARVTGI